MARGAAEENLTTATLTKMTKNVNLQLIKKRTHEEITDKSEEDDDYEDENEDDDDDYDKQEEFIDQMPEKIADISNYGRHELFKWAFKLSKNEEYIPPKDTINELILNQESDLDHLNRLSICILNNWADNDEVLAQILRISLSEIIDLAHDWTSRYCKSVFPDAPVTWKK